jgi:hypothetical protein
VIEDILSASVPGVHILARRKDFLSALNLFFQKAFEIQELRSDDLVFEMSQPALMKSVDLQREQLLLLVGELRNPSFLVKL